MKIRMIKAVLLSAFWLVLLSTPGIAARPSGDDRFPNQVDSLLTESTEPSGPGLAVVITKAGTPIFRKCYGLADLEHRVPIASTTTFNLASTAKQFTAFSILLLEQEGRIDLDEDIRKYLPELPEYSTPVSVRNLLYHTSGIWEFYSTMVYYCGYDKEDHFTLKEIMELLQHQKALLFEPGSQWNYCNTNYVLLAQIVERITGTSFQQWTKSHIFDPLGMSRSCFIENGSQVIPGRAEPYRIAGGKFIRDPGDWVDYVGHGYLYTTIDDMALWMDNFRTKKLGGDALIAKMLQKGTLADGSESFYGYGLGVLTRSGMQVVSHSGQTAGYKSYMLYCPELELGLTLLADERSIDCEGLGDRIFALYLGKDIASDAAAESPELGFVSSQADSAEKFAGGYLVEGMNAKLAVNVEDSFLHCAFWGLGEDFFYPLSERRFATRSGSSSIEFIAGPEGAIDQAEIFIREDKFIARPIALKAGDLMRRLPEYTGDYYSKAFEVVYGCHPDEGHLVMHHRRYGDMRLQPIDADEFFFILGFVRFHRSPGGEVTGFTLVPSDEGFHFQPIEFVKVSSAE